MPVTVAERYDFEFALGADGTITSKWFAFGSEDEDEILDAIAATIPTIFGTKRLREVPVVHLGGGHWEIEAHYAETLSEFSFDTGGGTTKITQSIATVASYPAGAPNFQGAIGVSSDKVEGCDIVSPQYNWNETHTFDLSLITAGYKATLFSLTGTVANASFKGFAVGESLFVGASGSQRGTDDFQIQFKFVGSPNATGLTIGTITGITKRGHDYLWVRYVDDVNANSAIKRPASVHVEQTYPFANHALLGIGT